MHTVVARICPRLWDKDKRPSNPGGRVIISFIYLYLYVVIWVMLGWQSAGVIWACHVSVSHSGAVEKPGLEFVSIRRINEHNGNRSSAYLRPPPPLQVGVSFYSFSLM